MPLPHERKSLRDRIGEPGPVLPFLVRVVLRYTVKGEARRELEDLVRFAAPSAVVIRPEARLEIERQEIREPEDAARVLSVAPPP